MRARTLRYAYSYDEYLTLEADAPLVRHEYVEGDILAMAGGSDLHSALTAAVTGELYRELRGTPCGIRESNLRVRVEATGNAFYADALVICGGAEIVHEIRGGDSLLNPTLIVEVLSPSTERYDRGEKFEENYRLIPALREYVLVSQEETLVEVRSRDDAGNWISREFRAGEQARLAAVGCTLDIDTLYGEARKNIGAEGA